MSAADRPVGARSFLDTNVLVYTDDADTPEKRDAALDLVEELYASRCAVLSTQVLQEYYVAGTRKLGVEPSVAREKVRLFAKADLVRLDLPHILGAIDLVRLRSLSFWDALIVRAALDAGCRVLYTEDLNEGERIEGLEIVNPFA